MEAINLLPVYEKCEPWLLEAKKNLLQKFTDVAFTKNLPQVESDLDQFFTCCMDAVSNEVRYCNGLSFPFLFCCTPLYVILPSTNCRKTNCRCHTAVEADCSRVILP